VPSDSILYSVYDYTETHTPQAATNRALSLAAVVDGSRYTTVSDNRGTDETSAARTNFRPPPGLNLKLNTVYTGACRITTEF